MLRSKKVNTLSADDPVYRFVRLAGVLVSKASIH